VLAIANIMQYEVTMAKTRAANNEQSQIPASLQRRAKEPAKSVHFQIPLSWWEELSRLAREFDQDVSIFLREAIEDWLRRARKFQIDASEK
jgi:hypothetical protein